MSKGSIFWGKSRGKLGEMVLAVVKGQQTQRAYNGTPANPRTELQQVQRIKFAAAVKFYKSSVQNMFKMAFEGKKQTESDYNAFMRINLKEGIAIFPTKEEVDNPFFPMVAPWRVSQGSLNSVGMYKMEADGYSDYRCASPIYIADYLEDTSWENFLANHREFQTGDILTFATMAQKVLLTGTSIVTPQKQPAWKINSIIIGADLRGGTIQDYIDANDMNEYEEKLAHYVDITSMGFVSDDGDDLAIGSVCIHSRPRSGGLLVSSEHIHLNDLGQQVFEFLSDDGNRALGSWDAQRLAILQGSEEKEAYGAFTAKKVTNVTLPTGTYTGTPVVTDFTPELHDDDTLQLIISVGGGSHTFKGFKASEDLETETFTIGSTTYKIRGICTGVPRKLMLLNSGTSQVTGVNVTTLRVNGINVRLTEE